MNIKRTTIFIIVTIISLSLISCGTLRDKMVKERVDMLNSSNDNEVADKCVEKIINCIENKDKEGLKEIFSPNALKEANDIDGGVEYLLSFYKGKIQSRDKGTISSNEHTEHGERTTTLDCKYVVTTDEDTYIVFFRYNTIDTKEPDNVGVYMLQIIKKSDRETQFDWGGKKTRCTGIYMPDSEKQQITE